MLTACSHLCNYCDGENETQVGINLHKDSSIFLHQQQCDKNCFSMIMNLPRGTSSCLPSHQSEQPAQVSPARRTSRGSTACFTCSRWVGRLEEEVSSTPGDSLTAALPETTKVIGWWNDRPHSYPHSRGQGNRQGAGRGRRSMACFTLFWRLVLFACVTACEDIFMHAAIYIQYAHCTEISWREVGVGAWNIL